MNTVDFDIFETTENLAGLSVLDSIEKITNFIPVELQSKYEITVTESDDNSIEIDFNQDRTGLTLDIDEERPCFIGYMRFAECHVIFTFEPNDRLAIFGETLGKSFNGNNVEFKIGDEMEEELLKQCFEFVGIEPVDGLSSDRVVVVGEEDID